MAQTPPAIEQFETTDSTTLHARRAAAAGEIGSEGRLFVARRQTHAIGRFGRRWESPEGGLWFTLARPLSPSPRSLDGLGLRIGLACALAVERATTESPTPVRVHLKWPNDVLVNGKKLLGVLCEVANRPGGAIALVGVGVNANFPVGALPPALRAGATTLLDETSRPVDLDAILAGLAAGIIEALEEPGLDAATLDAVRARLWGVGAPAVVTLADGSTRRGVLLGLSDHGRLRLAAGDAEYLAPAGAELALPL